MHLRIFSHRHYHQSGVHESSVSVLHSSLSADLRLLVNAVSCWSSEVTFKMTRTVQQRRVPTNATGNVPVLGNLPISVVVYWSTFAFINIAAV